MLLNLLYLPEFLLESRIFVNFYPISVYNKCCLCAAELSFLENVPTNGLISPHQEEHTVSE